MPWPLNRVAGFKLMPMGFPSFVGCVCCPCVFPGFGLLLEFLVDAAVDAQHFGARYLQDEVAACRVEILDNDLVSNLSIPLHLDFIPGQFGGKGKILHRRVFLLWLGSRSGLGKSWCCLILVRSRLRLASRS